MNSRKPQQSLLFIVIGIWLMIGCSMPVPSPDPTATAIIVSQSPTASPALPTRTVTANVSPTLNASRTASPSPSITAISTKQPTIAASLEPERQEDYINGLLKDNGGCQLPCWWGISPGQTPWMEAAALFRFLGERPGEFRTESGIHSYSVGFQYPKKPGWLSDLQLQLFDKDGIVEAIEVSSNNYSLPDEFHSKWSEFSPEKLIQTYGKPSQIWIHTTRYMRKNPTGKHDYILWIFYDELGFFVRYLGRIEFRPTYRLCPTYGTGDLDAGIDMYLQSSDDKNSLLEVSELMQYQPEVLTIEEATGLTLDDIVTLFTQSAQPYCFESPREIWP